MRNTRNCKKKVGPAALLGLCYALAVALWVVSLLVRGGILLTHKANGTMRTLTLQPQELQCESFVNYEDLAWNEPPEEGENWYLSTDNDPHLLWNCEDVPLYLETVRMDARHDLAPGAVTLYYRTPGQQDFSEAQKIYAALDREGRYCFDLGGVTVSALRIDPDSVGGVPTQLHGVELNPPEFWAKKLLPNGGQAILLAFGPAVAAALFALLRWLFAPAAKQR